MSLRPRPSRGREREDRRRRDAPRSSPDPGHERGEPADLYYYYDDYEDPDEGSPGLEAQTMAASNGRHANPRRRLTSSDRRRPPSRRDPKERAFLRPITKDYDPRKWHATPGRRSAAKTRTRCIHCGLHHDSSYHDRGGGSRPAARAAENEAVLRREAEEMRQSSLLRSGRRGRDSQQRKRGSDPRRRSTSRRLDDVSEEHDGERLQRRDLSPDRGSVVSYRTDPSVSRRRRHGHSGHGSASAGNPRHHIDFASFDGGPSGRWELEREAVPWMDNRGDDGMDLLRAHREHGSDKEVARLQQSISSALDAARDRLNWIFMHDRLTSLGGPVPDQLSLEDHIGLVFDRVDVLVEDLIDKQDTVDENSTTGAQDGGGDLVGSGPKRRALGRHWGSPERRSMVFVDDHGDDHVSKNVRFSGVDGGAPSNERRPAGLASLTVDSSPASSSGAPPLSARRSPRRPPPSIQVPGGEEPPRAFSFSATDRGMGPGLQLTDLDFETY